MINIFSATYVLYFSRASVTGVSRELTSPSGPSLYVCTSELVRKSCSLPRVCPGPSTCRAVLLGSYSNYSERSYISLRSTYDFDDA